MENKIKVETIWGKLDHVLLNNIRVDVNNIDNFDLYLTRENKKVRYFKLNKEDRGFYIYHDKKTGKVDWCERINKM